MNWDMIGAVVGTFMATLAVVKIVGGGSWKLSGRLTSMETTIEGVQKEMKRFGDVLEKVADMRGDLRVLSQRLTNAEQDIRDMQHGESYVLPIAKSAHERP